jgi:hypothetical protein
MMRVLSFDEVNDTVIPAIADSLEDAQRMGYIHPDAKEPIRQILMSKFQVYIGAIKTLEG